MCWWKKKRKEDKENKNDKKAVKQENLPVITLDAKNPFIIARSKAKLACGSTMGNNYTAITEPDGDGYYLVVRTGEINISWGYKWDNHKYRAYGKAIINRSHQNDETYDDKNTVYEWSTAVINGVEVGFLYESIYDSEKGKFIGFSHCIYENIFKKYFVNIDVSKVNDNGQLQNMLNQLNENPQFCADLNRLGIDTTTKRVEFIVGGGNKIED